MKIIGAGLSGLLCGALNPGSTIYEAQTSLPNNHGAILRFRSDEISKALGIPFKKVMVTKAVHFAGRSQSYIDPELQNMYSYKVTRTYGHRSISNIAPVERYIAPDNFISLLAKRCNIVYGRAWPIDAIHIAMDEPIVSTIPLPVMLQHKPFATLPEFKRQGIWVQTFNVPSCNLYQTIYFPGPETALYRASFTGSNLICEFVSDPRESNFNFHEIMAPFGLHDGITCTVGHVQSQQYGKIVEADRQVIRAILSELTHKHNIYSLGRFATWRNILLDDVYNDIFRIRDLMNLDSWSRRLVQSEEK